MDGVFVCWRKNWKYLDRSFSVNISHYLQLELSLSWWHNSIDIIVSSDPKVCKLPIDLNDDEWNVFYVSWDHTMFETMMSIFLYTYMSCIFKSILTSFVPLTLLGALSDFVRGQVTSVWGIKRSLGRSWYMIAQLCAYTLGKQSTIWKIVLHSNYWDMGLFSGTWKTARSS